MTKPPDTIVFSDLDGTLLDHNSYTFDAALPALHRLVALNIPLIFCSSKTRSEILHLQQALDIHQPFVVENGAAIHGLTHSTGALMHYQAEDTVQLGLPRGDILRALHLLRDKAGFRFTGFSDLDTGGIAELTGLDSDAAARAAQREYSEPLLWQDNDARRAPFLAELRQLGLHAEQGGRFLTVSSGISKGDAVAKIREQLSAASHAPVTIIALGDAPNDLSMLQQADIAVVIRSAYSDALHPDKPSHVLRPEQPGPAGWCESIMTILDGEY